MSRNRNSHRRKKGGSSGCRGRARRHRIKKPTQSYGMYIRKLLKKVHPCNTISSKAVSVLNSFMNYSFQLLAVEAGNLVRHKKQKTMTSADIKSAAVLMLPRVLAEYAIRDGDKAARKFVSS